MFHLLARDHLPPDWFFNLFLSNLRQLKMDERVARNENRQAVRLFDGGQSVCYF